jgi:prephenate dehydratase
LPSNPLPSGSASRDAGLPRVAFQGEAGAFSEATAIQLLGGGIRTVPCFTFDAAFRSISDGAADALLVPVENSLAGSVVRVFDLLLDSDLEIVGETILRIEHQLIGCPGATLAGLRSVASHPVALAQCERFFLAHPELKRVPAEDTAGSVREVVARGDRSAAGIAGRRAAEHYGGAILAENIHDNPENFTRFVLLVPTPHASGENSSAAIEWSSRPLDPARSSGDSVRTLSRAQTDLLVALHTSQWGAADSSATLKMSLALRLAHKPGALLAALEPFARHGVNLLKIESRPIHGRPWEYQFFLDIESAEGPQQANQDALANALSHNVGKLQSAVAAVRSATSDLRVLGVYPPARIEMAGRQA